ncbi:MAG: hypothetical protein ACLGHP_08395 [Vicinamibacteria bacterium]
MIRSSLVAVAVAIGLAAPGAAQAPAGSLDDVTGVWVMEVMGHQFGLELEQDGEAVQGIMLAMGRRVLLVGAYTGRTLTLKGERPEDGHTDGGPIVATMRDDGTLEGELSTNHGRTKWTGSRLKTP